MCLSLVAVFIVGVLVIAVAGGGEDALGTLTLVVLLIGALWAIFGRGRTGGGGGDDSDLGE